MYLLAQFTVHMFRMAVILFTFCVYFSCLVVVVSFECLFFSLLLRLLCCGCCCCCYWLYYMCFFPLVTLIAKSFVASISTFWLLICCSGCASCVSNLVECTRKKKVAFILQCHCHNICCCLCVSRRVKKRESYTCTLRIEDELKRKVAQKSDQYVEKKAKIKRIERQLKTRNYCNHATIYFCFLSLIHSVISSIYPAISPHSSRDDRSSNK